MGFSDFENNNKHAAMTDINITPFVDVLLVLLIIFMVTAPFAVSGVDVKIPQEAAKPMTLNEDPLILSITLDGRMFLKQYELSSEEALAKLQAARGGDKEASLFVRADKQVPYEQVMKAMVLAQKAGFVRIGMLSQGTGTP